MLPEVAVTANDSGIARAVEEESFNAAEETLRAIDVPSIRFMNVSLPQFADFQSDDPRDIVFATIRKLW
jgi:hypothetical protein